MTTAETTGRPNEHAGTKRGTGRETTDRTNNKDLSKVDSRLTSPLNYPLDVRRPARVKTFSVFTAPSNKTSLVYLLANRKRLDKTTVSSSVERAPDLKNSSSSAHLPRHRSISGIINKSRYKETIGGERRRLKDMHRTSEPSVMILILLFLPLLGTEAPPKIRSNPHKYPTPLLSSYPPRRTGPDEPPLEVKNGVKWVEKTASLGNSKVLECHINHPKGHPSRFIVTWKKKGVEAPIFTIFDGYQPRPDSSFDGRIRSVGQASIEISNIRQADGGWYECVVLFLDKNDDGTGNSNNINGTWIYLSVYTPPKIFKSSPDLVLKKSGENLDIFCYATGNPEPTLTWFKDGRDLSLHHGHVLHNNFIRNGSHLLIHGVSKENSGVYVCFFKNLIGTISRSVKLVIRGNGWISSSNVYIINPPKNTTVMEGTKARLSCQADGHPNNLTYQWFREGSQLSHYPHLLSRTKIHPDGTLVINPIMKNDRGWFQCRASNNLGEPPEAKAFLNVTYLPTVVGMPARLYFPNNMSGRIECQIDSNPPVTLIVWSRDGRHLDFSQLQNFRLERGGTLIIKPVTPKDEGRYSCTPYSPLGEGHTSTHVEVHVRDLPYFSARPHPIYQKQPTQSVSMPCMAEGDPPPMVTWRKVPQHQHEQMPSTSKVHYTGGNLTIINLAKEDSGIYECVVSSTMTVIITTTLLIVETTTPHPAQNVNVTTRETTAKLTWLPAYDAGFSLHYMIWYRIKEVGRHWLTISVPHIEHSCSAVVHELYANEMYEFMVMTRSRLDLELFSDVVVARTKSTSSIETIGPDATFPPPQHRAGSHYGRPNRPTNLTVHQTPHGALHITWYVPAFFSDTPPHHPPTPPPSFYHPNNDDDDQHYLYHHHQRPSSSSSDVLRHSIKSSLSSSSTSSDRLSGRESLIDSLGNSFLGNANRDGRFSLHNNNNGGGGDDDDDDDENDNRHHHHHHNNDNHNYDRLYHHRNYIDILTNENRINDEDGIDDDDDFEGDNDDDGDDDDGNKVDDRWKTKDFHVDDKNTTNKYKYKDIETHREEHRHHLHHQDHQEQQHNEITKTFFQLQYKTVGQHWITLAEIPSFQMAYNWTTASRGVKYHFRVVPAYVIGVREHPHNTHPSPPPARQQKEGVTFEGEPSEVVSLDTGDPMSTNKMSDETIGIMIGGVVIIGISGVFLVAVFRCLTGVRSRRKSSKGIVLATSEPDQDFYVENFSDLDNQVFSKPRSVKETPI